MRLLQTASLCAIAVLATACAVPPVSEAPVRTALVIPAGVNSNDLQLNRILVRLPREQSGYKVQFGWFCEPGIDRGWPLGQLPVSYNDLAEAFNGELGKHQYKVVGLPESVFDSGQRAELQVGGIVNRLEANFCFPFSGRPTLDVGITDRIKGNIFMQVTWEVYSVSQSKVVFTTTTQGAFKAEEAVRGGVPGMLVRAFSANLRNLAADPGFHGVVLKTPEPSALAPPGAKT
jgi:hypothetical protein